MRCAVPSSFARIPSIPIIETGESERFQVCVNIKSYCRLLLLPFSRYLCCVFTTPALRKSFTARRTVDSDSFKSLEIVGMDGQQMPSLLALSAR